MTRRYSVVVGNVGVVAATDAIGVAIQAFNAYRRMSERGEGRAAGEWVVLLDDAEILREWEPSSRVQE